MIDIKTAAKRTFKRASGVDCWNDPWKLFPPQCSRALVLRLLDSIIREDIVGDHAHRVLGWCQCAMFINDDAIEIKDIQAFNTVEEPKSITCGYCKDCAYRNKNKQCCNDEKIDEANKTTSNDYLSYSRAEDGIFEVGDFFGCVHFAPREQEEYE